MNSHSVLHFLFYKMHISLLCLLKGLEIIINSLAMNTHSIQIIISNYYSLSFQEPKHREEMEDLSIEQESYQRLIFVLCCLKYTELLGCVNLSFLPFHKILRLCCLNIASSLFLFFVTPMDRHLISSFCPPCFLTSFTFFISLFLSFHQDKLCVCIFGLLILFSVVSFLLF